jgi:acetoin utilization deacetylase AcuC-like enzyme
MVSIITDSLFREHDTGPYHPERPERFDAALRGVEGHKIIHPRDATVNQLLLCHTASYIERVKNDVEHGLFYLSTDTVDTAISPKSYEAALRAVGAVLTAVDLVMTGEDKTAFCLVRPPGHHACSDRGMGFCLFNNIAIGARYAQQKYGIKRVLIVDWDLHHGNGTQEIFQNDSSIFYFSTHQYPFYPGTGAESAGTMMNIPIRDEVTSREDILHAFQVILPQEMEVFKPELVMISAGFDSHEADPLGGLRLKSEDYETLTKAVKTIAETYASDRIVSALEGGYNLRALEESVRAHVEVL